ncbi:MAG: hypothetical protein H7308_14755 [Chthonomonadaceae bacterium]|nr:hypothetical protein [Chthonomonadaceae bacterium]
MMSDWIVVELEVAKATLSLPETALQLLEEERAALIFLEVEAHFVASKGLR